MADVLLVNNEGEIVDRQPLERFEHYNEVIIKINKKDVDGNDVLDADGNKVKTTKIKKVKHKYTENGEGFRLIPGDTFAAEEIWELVYLLDKDGEVRLSKFGVPFPKVEKLKFVLDIDQLFKKSNINTIDFSTTAVEFDLDENGKETSTKTVKAKHSNVVHPHAVKVVPNAD